MSNSSILFAGGGTGGHIFMAVALAERLRMTQPDTRFLFVGTRRGLEKRILTPLGYEWTTIDIGGLNRVGAVQKLVTLFKLPGSLLDSRSILKKFAPSLLVGLGGYASGPLALAAGWLKIPILLIEPNVEPGMANRLLGRWARRVAVAFPETARRFGSKARLTGIPVRDEFHGIRAPIRQDGPLRLLVFGGSQGSRPLNLLVPQALALLPRGEFEVTHQTGPRDLGNVEEIYRQSEVAADVRSFLDDMPSRFAGTDLVLSRSGASTVAELAASGRPSLLIPFPLASDDHQRKNALALARRGASLMLEQSQTGPEQLAQALRALAQDRQALQKMSDAARQLAQPESIDKILDVIREMSEDQRQPRGRR